jgi:hypothetical protein
MRPDLLSSVSELNNDELLARAKRLALREREATATLVAHLAEIDARRLYLGQGCASLFAYCTEVLELSEDAAYSRMEAARAVRKYPVILGLLEEGDLHLTAVRLLAPHLTLENHEALLWAARHRSRRAIEKLVAGLRPLPDVPALVRKLPAPAPKAEAQTAASPASAGMPGNTAGEAQPSVVARPLPAPRPLMQPLAPDRYLVRFTGDGELEGLLRQAHDLLGLPRSETGAVVKRALRLLVRDLERKKHGAAERPRPQAKEPVPGSRHIPSAIKREVWKRDGGRCTFVGSDGRAVQRDEGPGVRAPYGLRQGGPATAQNVALSCPAQNCYEAEQEFGTGGPEGWTLREPFVRYAATKRASQPERELAGSASPTWPGTGYADGADGELELRETPAFRVSASPGAG